MLGRFGYIFFCGVTSSLAETTMELSCQLSRGRESDPSIIIRPPPPQSTSRRCCILAHNYPLPLSMLISADEILGFHLSCMPKIPASPIMAFYIGHINLRLSPPEGIALYWPQSIPRAQDLRLVNELQEGSSRSVKHSHIDTHNDPLLATFSPIFSACTSGRMQGAFNLSRVTIRH